MSQVSMSLGAMQPAVPTPIPVMPVGASVSLVMTKLEALLFMTFEIITKIIQTLLANYQKAYDKAMKTREESEKKLLVDEQQAQKDLEPIAIKMKEELDTLTLEMEKLTNEHTTEMALYNAQLFIYKEELTNAVSEELMEATKRKIDSLEPWLAKIISIVIEITNKKIEKIFLQIDYDKILELLALKIDSEWEWLETYAGDFNVAVPYHPDLPELPSLPQIPPIPNEPPLVKATRKALAKWMATPSVPPLGILISALMTMLAGLAPAPAPLAAKKEAINDALLLQMAGCF